MDSARLSSTRARLVRMRWRRAGAWLWPLFVVLTFVDATIGHALPPAGSTESLAAAALLGLVVNLFGVLFLSRPIGWVLRRLRTDMPSVVARDYAGTLVVLAVSASLLVAGLVHRPAIQASRLAMQDAIVRAQAFIGDRAPDEFRRNLQFVSVLSIQGAMIYRACVPNPERTKSYCVVVDRSQPFDRSVKFSGYEPNATLASGTD
ncbi:MAG: hypothetical protein JO027_01905 [Solirubrobacterales bacterium]|nr:hypothetical protein [Solirubrobacterales bacterium]